MSVTDIIEKMSDIVFIQIQNKGNSNLWLVIDNKTGDIKGFIVRYKYLGLDSIEYIAYQFCYIDVKGEMQIHEVDELTDVQLFFINEVF